MNMTRRRILCGSSALVATSVLAACQTSTNGTVTTYSFDFSKIQSVGPIALQGVSNAVASPAIASLIGAAGMATVNAALKTATDDFAAINKAIGPGLTLTIDSASFVTLGKTFLADVQTAMGPVTALAAANPTAATYASAFSTLVTALQLAFALAGAKPASGGMTETAAIAVLSKPAR